MVITYNFKGQDSQLHDSSQQGIHPHSSQQEIQNGMGAVSFRMMPPASATLRIPHLFCSVLQCTDQIAL